MIKLLVAGKEAEMAKNASETSNRPNNGGQGAEGLSPSGAEGLSPSGEGLSPRRGFAGKVGGGWLYRQELRFLRNFIKNWDKNVSDEDFFDPFANVNHIEEKDVVLVLNRTFSAKELEGIDGLCVANKPRKSASKSLKRQSHVIGGDVVLEEADDLGYLGIFDLEDEDPAIIGRSGKKISSVRLRDVPEVLMHIWNKQSLRSRCRAMLLKWVDALDRREALKMGTGPAAPCPVRAAQAVLLGTGPAAMGTDPMEERFNELCQMLKLDEVSRDVFAYALVRKLTCFDDFPLRNIDGTLARVLFFAMATDWPEDAVRAVMSSDSNLRRCEVIDDEGDFLRNSPFPQYLEIGGKALLNRRFFRKVDLSDALPWDYYGKLVREHGEILKRLIATPSVNGHGVNILLYGAPGTGKTSFVQTLVRELGRSLYEIRQGDKDGDNDSLQARRIGLRVCNNQLTPEKDVLLVDEADGLLETKTRNLGFFTLSPRSDKGVVNSILDEMRLPTIWISNADPEQTMDASVCRRFAYSIRFEPLDSNQRQSIWRNNVEKFGLGAAFSATDIARLADAYPTNAGGIASVLENVKRLSPEKGGEMALLDQLMKPFCAMTGAKIRDAALQPARDYSLDGLNISGDVGLDRVVEAVRRFRAEVDAEDSAGVDRPRMNLLLWGPPGTGKTEFVKYLGQQVNARVVVRMGSDLLDRYVGGTEQRIKRAFREAEAENAFLFFDEIDGLVRDRGDADRSWEVTQVNELLHQMENFKGVMVAATNFMDSLDRAILRRFTFKLEFGYLDDAGKRLFFERMFKTALSPEDAARLGEMRNLAPGDFRTVRQSLYYLGGGATNADRIAALERETSLKRNATSRARIGF